VAVAGYIDDHVKPPAVEDDVTPCTPEDTAAAAVVRVLDDSGDSVVDVVLAALRVVLEVRVVVAVDDKVMLGRNPAVGAGTSKPASRAQVSTSSPFRQQKPGTGAHHVPASQ
jgi:hypothetical protein